MNIVVIGLGSMGRRRIRHLQRYCNSNNIVGIDCQDNRREQVNREFGIKTYKSIDDALREWTFESAFVCTSPLTHGKIISDCLDLDLHVFTEINLVSDLYFENIQKAKARRRVLFISSTPMYRKEMQWIKFRLNSIKSPISYQYHVGNYLPDWHPWESYKDFFVGEKITNGCREFMAIEFPWLIDVFGEVVGFFAASSKVTGLDLDYPDTINIILKHINGNIGSLMIDVASRKAVRDFTCSAEDCYFEWHGTPDTLLEYDINRKKDAKIELYNMTEHLDGYNSTIIEDAYFDEIVDFFRCILEDGVPKHSFEKDAKILSLINSIEGECV